MTTNRLCCLLLTTILAGCEELGKDARGEIQTTAMQTVGIERTCIPLADMTSARGTRDGDVMVVLRDGTRWRNSPDGSCPGARSASQVAFAAGTDEACAQDRVLLLESEHGIARHSGTCTLGTFNRL